MGGAERGTAGVVGGSTDRPRGPLLLVGYTPWGKTGSMCVCAGGHRGDKWLVADAGSEAWHCPASTRHHVEMMAVTVGRGQS